MIVGIGVDLVKIDRIDKAGKSHPGFLERVFTDREREYCSKQKFPAQHSHLAVKLVFPGFLRHELDGNDLAFRQGG